VAIDGSKFKAVNNRDRNFTSSKLKRRMEEVESSINRYLTSLDAADRQVRSAAEPDATHLDEYSRWFRHQFACLTDTDSHHADSSLC
jgi:hypothetical protein